MFTLKKVTSSEQLCAVYDTLYAQSWLPSRTSLLRWSINLLEGEPGQLLLDVACGDAQMAPLARKAGLMYYGVDFSPVAVEKAHTKTVFAADGQHLPFASQTFDLVTNIGSLEHFTEMSRGIREMARVLKANGKACILVPNAFGLTWNVLHVWRTGNLADDDGQPVQRFGTRGAWEYLLQTNGLHIDRTIGHERRWPRTTTEWNCLLYTSPSPRDRTRSRMPSSA